jgi:hypothetical protein
MASSRVLSPGRLLLSMFPIEPWLISGTSMAISSFILEIALEIFVLLRVYSPLKTLYTASWILLSGYE